MTNTESKPREFELFYSGLVSVWSVRIEKQIESSQDDMYLDVIEKSWAEAEIKRLEADRDKWKKCAEELKYYIRHARGCERTASGTCDCTCGMHDVLLQFNAINEPKGE